MKKLLFAMALGAGLAYLLDPDNGPRRRASLQRLADKATGVAPSVAPVAVVPVESDAARVTSVR